MGTLTDSSVLADNYQSGSCALCQSDEAVLLYKRAHWLIYQCKKCHLIRVQMAPRSPEEIEEARLIEESLGDDYMQKVFIDEHDFWLDYWRKQVARIEPYITEENPRLLDIGCGMGHFLLAAREAGWQTIGVELSEKQADYAREMFNLDVYGSHIEESNFQPHSFDIITLWSVIEHVNDPKEVMGKVHDLLKPGGLVIVKTPNQESLITALTHWAYVVSGGRILLPIYSDEHLYRFSESNLRYLLDEAGFKAQSIEQDDNYRIMRTRIKMEKHFSIYDLVMKLVHPLAKISHRENQLLAIARSV